MNEKPHLVTFEPVEQEVPLDRRPEPAPPPLRKTNGRRGGRLLGTAVALVLLGGLGYGGWRDYTQRQEADDLIEEFIRHDSSPRQLTIVSNDRRLKDAARRRQCRVLGCADFLDQIDRQRHTAGPPPPEKSAKPDEVTRDETQHWLREFGDLANDPKLKGWVDLGPGQESDE